MANGGRKILVTSIVFLLQPDSIRKTSLSPEDLEEILTPQITMGQTADGRLLLSSMGDQIEVLLGADRFDVRDLSSKTPREKPLASIMERLVEKTGTRPRAFGLNYEIECPIAGEAAGAFLKTKFLSSNELTGEADGAAITLYSLRETKRYTLKLEPRRGRPTSGSVYVNLNVHQDLQTGEREGKSSVEAASLEQMFIFEYHRLSTWLDRLFGK